MVVERETKVVKLFAFFQGKLLIKRVGESYVVPSVEELPAELREGRTLHALAAILGTEAFALDLESAPSGDEWLLTDLRASYDLISRSDYRLAGEAAELIYWDAHSRFCPVCGRPTERRERIMKKCPACGYELYPPIATATIVLIRRGDRALLVRARNFRGNFHGLVAGFLEPGETLEECVRREVREETGLSIKNITYFDSQPWPYPCGLMVGFNAEYEGGELELRDGELSTAAFFSKDDLPQLPQKLSIARRLIDNWLTNG